MSFDKNYSNRKDIRKAYRKSKVVDKQCRNHGKCTYCKGNRLCSTNKRKQSSEFKMKEHD